MQIEKNTYLGMKQTKESRSIAPIHRMQKDGGCTFYHNTLRIKLSPLGIWKDMI